MNILFTICARAGSKGLKNKNIAYFLGKPLCYQTLSVYDDFCKKYPVYNCYLALNTDSKKLIEQVKNYGIPFEYVIRTPELAGDVVAKIDVIRDTFFKVNGEYDLVVDLDLTSPLRTVEDIHGVILTLLSNKKADGVFSVTRARRSPYFNQVKRDNDDFYRPIIKTNAVARQQVPEVFDMNASIYAFRSSFLKKNGKRFFAGKMLVYCMRDTAVLDIDDPNDRDLLEIIAKYWLGKVI